MPSERVQRQIDALLDEAEAAIKQSDWALVRDRARNVLAMDPESEDARFYLTAADRALTTQPETATELPAVTESVAAPAALPTSFVDGRYEVKKLLGEGGKKRVYLAHDSLLDRDVAFALIKTDGLDDVGRERVRREAQAMGRLGAHPHVVSVFDLGEAEGEQFIVTELMDGGDVEGLIDRAEAHRVPLADALRIADQVCRGLEFAHEKGIVHRDLKPGNIWLSADGTAKIGDFGLAVAVDRARLTQAGLMVGTVSYMPPEQALGGEVTPRSDLYSLGAMLYELVTGRPPFVGDESVAIITQHLNTPPVAPSWHAQDLPAGLEALIFRLLEKDPARRPASASEVRQALAGVGVRGLGVGVAGTSPPPDTLREGGLVPQSPTPSPQSPSPIYRRVFVGREPELHRLEAAFDAALSGEGSLILVVGEPGIGKTALCEQLATYVALRGGRSLVGHSYEEGSLSRPYLPFVEALRTYVLAREPEGLKQDLGSGAQEVARIVSEIRDRVGLSPAPDPQPPTPQLDPEEERWRLLQAVLTFLSNASTVQPLLIVLEDLHWADRGTLELLLHLTRNLRGSRILIVGTYRDVEVDRSHPLSGTLAELRRVQEMERVLLRGLTPDEVHRMVSAITGQEVRWSLAEAVHRQTEGNPLFIQEVLRYLVEAGHIEREEGRWRRTGDAPPEMAIPEGLRDVIGKRLLRLSPECNGLLSVAAVIGREFAPDVLQAVAGSSEADLLSALEEARRIGVLEELIRPGQVRYRFAHAFFRQVLYEELIAPRRIRLHQQVGRAIEAQHAARLEDHAAELAEHFSHSSDAADLTRAVRYGGLAARRAMAVYAYGEAARQLERALQVQDVLDPDDLAKRCDLLLELGRALAPAGEPQRVFETIGEEAFTLAHRLNDGGRAAQAAELAVEAGHRYGYGRTIGTPRYKQWVERLAAEAPLGTGARVRAEAMLAEIYRQGGRWGDGRVIGRAAFDAARRMDDPETLFRVAQYFVSSFLPPKDWQEGQLALRELAARDRSGVSVHTLSNFLRSGQGTFLAAGDRESAEDLRLELVQLSAHSRDAGLVFQGLAMEGERLMMDGDLEGGLASTEQMIARGDELGSPTAARLMASFVALRSLLYLGRPEQAVAHVGLRGGGFRVGERALCLASMGRLDEARTELAANLGRAEISDQTAVRALATLLEAAVLVGDAEAAGRLARLLGDIPGAVPPPVGVARIVAAADVLVGDRAAARAHLQRALEWATAIRHRPEIALTRLQLAELLLEEAQALTPTPHPTLGEGQTHAGGPPLSKLGEGPGVRAEALAHLDFAIEELRAMKMQPSLERALRHKGLLRA